MFEQAGWVCCEACNGQEGVLKAQQFKPDIVVLDLSMPVMNGLEAGNILKDLVPQTPLILFTSFSGIVSSDGGQRSAFSKVIDKNDAGRLVVTAQALLPKL
ncbi:MAG: response regulator [Terriglobales bacterium]